MDNLKTNFGKRKVSQKDKTFLVQEVFSNVAKNYDYMNDIMSFGTHRIWKKELVDFMNIQITDKVIDVGSGTGDLINLILKKNLTNNIYSIDLNTEMLKYGEKKFIGKKVKFVNANAERLPFSNDYFDKFIISFCLRNVTDVNKALNESYRVLKPGGIFYCLEFSKPENQIINLIYKNYKKNFIPFFGKKIANNKEAYQYLEESIDIFPNQKKLLSKINEIGFIKTSYLNFFNGIVALHTAYKI